MLQDLVYQYVLVHDKCSKELPEACGKEATPPAYLAMILIMNTEQKTLASLFVGIDISKKNNEICVLDTEGDVITRFEMSTDEKGFFKLITSLPKEGTPIFSMESTGPLTGNLVYFLRKKDYEVIECNPFEMSRLRAAFSKTVKTDAIDAYALAQAARMRVLKNSSRGTEYAYLQDILERYSDVNDHKTMVINQLRANLVETFPEFEEIMKDVSCKSAMAILGKYQTASQLLKAEAKEIKQLVNSKGGRISLKKISMLRELSQSTVAWKTSVWHQRIITSQVNELNLIMEELVIMENMIDEYIQEVLPEEMELVTSVPGLKKITGSHLLAHIGNHQRYDPNHDGQGASRVSAFFGFGLIEYSSGPRKSKGGISKRGNSGCRGLFSESFFRVSLNFFTFGFHLLDG